MGDVMMDGVVAGGGGGWGALRCNAAKRLYVGVGVLMMGVRVWAAVPQDLETNQTALGQLTGGLAISISPDSAHMAYVTHAGTLNAADRENLKPAYEGALRLIVDGKPGVASEKITTPVWSPDSQHIAYATMAHGKWEILEDDRVLAEDGGNIPGYQGRGEPVVFSPDSKHVATIVEKEFRWHVAVDGKEWPVISTPECGLLSFSPDSQHVAVVAKTRDTQMMYVDGVKLPPPSPPPASSEEGATKARELERIFPFYNWRPDGKAIGFAGAFPGKRWQAFVVPTAAGGAGEWGSSQVDGVLQGTPIFSFDSSRMAFVAKEKGKWRVYTESDESQEGFSEVDGPALTFVASPPEPPARKGEPSGKPRLIYITKSGGEGGNGGATAWNVYIDHKPIGRGGGYETFLKDTFVVSPDHEHWAVAAVREDKAVLIWDGKEVGTYDIASPGTFAFSPDSQHLACGVSINHRWHVWVDGQVGSADFFALHETPIAFSPDSKQVAYTAELNHGVGRVYVGTDGTYQSKFYESFLKGATVSWKDDRSLVTLGITRMIAYRVEMKIPG